MYMEYLHLLTIEARTLQSETHTLYSSSPAVSLNVSINSPV